MAVVDDVVSVVQRAAGNAGVGAGSVEVELVDVAHDR